MSSPQRLLWLERVSRPLHKDPELLLFQVLRSDVDFRKKNCTPKKIENYILLGGLAEDLPWKTASQIARRDGSKQVREEPEYIGVFATKSRY